MAIRFDFTSSSTISFWIACVVCNLAPQSKSFQHRMVKRNKSWQETNLGKTQNGTLLPSGVFLGRPEGAWRMPPKGSWAQKAWAANELWCLIMQPLCSKGSARGEPPAITTGHKPAAPAVCVGGQYGGARPPWVAVLLQLLGPPRRCQSECVAFAGSPSSSHPCKCSLEWVQPQSPGCSPQHDPLENIDDELAAFFRTLWNEIYPVLQRDDLDTIKFFCLVVET